jgi:hypothetical protein
MTLLRCKALAMKNLSSCGETVNASRSILLGCFLAVLLAATTARAAEFITRDLLIVGGNEEPLLRGELASMLWGVLHCTAERLPNLDNY